MDTSHPADPGFLIAVESLDGPAGDLCFCAAGLAQRMHAEMQAGTIPPRPIMLFVVGDESHPSLQQVRSIPNLEVFALPAYRTDEHQQAQERLHQALQDGYVAIMSNVLVSANAARRADGAFLNVKNMIDHAERKWDAIVYVDTPDGCIPSDHVVLHQQFHEIAEAAPGIAAVVPPCDGQSGATCENLWAVVKERMPELR